MFILQVQVALPPPIVLPNSGNYTPPSIPLPPPITLPGSGNGGGNGQQQQHSPTVFDHVGSAVGNYGIYPASVYAATSTYQSIGLFANRANILATATSRYEAAVSNVFNLTPLTSTPTPAALAAQAEAEAALKLADKELTIAEKTSKCKNIFSFNRSEYVNGLKGTIFGVLGKVLSVFGAGLAVYEIYSDNQKISDTTFSKKPLEFDISSALKKSDSRISTAIEDGDNIRLAGLLYNNKDLSSEQKKAFISQLTSLKTKGEVAEHNAKVSLKGLIGGGILGLVMAATGPIGWASLFTTSFFTICGGVGIGNLVSKLWRKSEPQRPQNFSQRH